MRRVGTSRIWPFAAVLWLVAAVARGTTLPADTLAAAKGRRVAATALEITAINAALVAHNRILRSDDAFSHITFSDIRRNLTHRHWWWDEDYFHTNTIEHPLHGALFYATARANGLSVGTSSLFTLGGSWMWEMLCEAEKPSINDMAYTTVGGITIGETLYRTTTRLLGTLGVKRWKGRDDTPFQTALTAGVRTFSATTGRRVTTAALTWEAHYGDPLDVEGATGLFDRFDLSATLVFGQHQSIASQVTIHSQLFSRQVADEPLRKVTAGLYNHFDYRYALPHRDLPKGRRERKPYVYSEVGAIGPGVAYRLGDRTRWEQQLCVNAILMGAVPTLTQHEGARGYSFGSGYGARLRTKAAIGQWLRVGLDIAWSQLFTWDGFYADDHSRSQDVPPSIQGEAGNAVTLLLDPSVEVLLMPHLSLHCQGGFSHFHFNHRYHPHSSAHASECLLGVKYTF